MTLLSRRRVTAAKWALAWLAATVVVFSLVPRKRTRTCSRRCRRRRCSRRADRANSPESRKGGSSALSTGKRAAADGCCSPGTRSRRRGRLRHALPGAAHSETGLEPPAPILAASGAAIFLLISCRSMSPRLISLRTLVAHGGGFALAFACVGRGLMPEHENPNPRRLSHLRSMRWPTRSALFHRPRAAGGRALLLGRRFRCSILRRSCRRISRVCDRDAQHFAAAPADSDSPPNHSTARRRTSST